MMRIKVIRGGHHYEKIPKCLGIKYHLWMKIKYEEDFNILILSLDIFPYQLYHAPNEIHYLYMHRLLLSCT